MGHLVINCDGCGSHWDVYRRDDWQNWKSRTCPVCGKAVDSVTWNHTILKAFEGMEEATLKLVENHAQSHGTLFTIEYIPDVTFKK